MKQRSDTIRFVQKILKNIEVMEFEFLQSAKVKWDGTPFIDIITRPCSPSYSLGATGRGTK